MTIYTSENQTVFISYKHGGLEYCINVEIVHIDIDSKRNKITLIGRVIEPIMDAIISLPKDYILYFEPCDIIESFN